MLRFEDWFWGTPADPTAGVKILHEHHIMGLAELEELNQFLKLRVAAEEAYCTKLADLSKSKSRADGFGKDESLLSQIFENSKEEMSNLGGSHRRVIEEISNTMQTVQHYLDESKKIFEVRKEKIDAASKQLATQRSELDALQADYLGKCKVADEEESKVDHVEDELPAMDVMINVGARLFTVEDFNTLLARMQRDLKTQDIRSIWGTTKDVIVGKDIAEYLGTYLRVDEKESAEILIHLINEGFFRPTHRISVTSLTSTNLNPSQTYVWKRYAIETEPIHRKARREADRADFAYRKAVTATEETRSSLELQCWEYMHTMQDAELRRIELVKQTLGRVNKSHEIVVEGLRMHGGHQAVYLEMLRPQKEVDILTERLRTGNIRIAPVVYKNAYSGFDSGLSTTGVPLEENAPAGSQSLPPFLRKCLTVVKEGREKGALLPADEFSLWITPSPPPQSFPDLHKPMAPPLMIPMIKQYLYHLPQSLVHPEIYDPLKLLYLSKTDEEEHHGRVGSLRSLLGVMPLIHWKATKELTGLLHELMLSFPGDDQKILDLAGSLGSAILRPMAPTAVTLHDKHPVRLMKDLLVHHPKIFSTSQTDRRRPKPATNGETSSLLDVDLDSDSRSHRSRSRSRGRPVAGMDADSDDELDIRVSVDGVVTSRTGSAASLMTDGGISNPTPALSMESFHSGDGAGVLAGLKLVEHGDEEVSWPVFRLPFAVVGLTYKIHDPPGY
ncbi:uncharacterized protein EV422DRAFT_492556 [Fimicolochytrium jonesii]|uniref:uncharacterized protein n=1 Tax=Fimicolochytrium jonesii TaxID=1396493 RepID=UPI0022FDD790|nr:uncharacterized protein EV422DRAFT_492556 [Fimicolochytrium jonesii]KAI8824953.1 hypothetical protein EV422DRAFT_492556 [Fimicolochytrium jonesii]